MPEPTTMAYQPVPILNRIYDMLNTWPNSMPPSYRQRLTDAATTRAYHMRNVIAGERNAEHLMIYSGLDPRSATDMWDFVKSRIADTMSWYMNWIVVVARATREDWRLHINQWWVDADRAASFIEGQFAAVPFNPRGVTVGRDWSSRPPPGSVDMAWATMITRTFFVEPVTFKIGRTLFTAPEAPQDMLPDQDRGADIHRYQPMNPDPWLIPFDGYEGYLARRRGQRAAIG